MFCTTFYCLRRVEFYRQKPHNCGHFQGISVKMPVQCLQKQAVEESIPNI